jgi:hypothetical protein
MLLPLQTWVKSIAVDRPDRHLGGDLYGTGVRFALASYEASDAEGVFLLMERGACNRTIRAYGFELMESAKQP